MERKKSVVRFRIRTKKGVDYPVRLHARIWVNDLKKYISFATDMLITPNQFKSFTTLGQATKSADEAVKAELDCYRDAADMVLTELTKTPNNPDLNHVYLSRRVNGLAARIKSNREAKNKPQPVSFRVSPYDVPCCLGCMYATKKECVAPWPLSAMQESAPDFANYNGICQMRKEAQNG